MRRAFPAAVLLALVCAAAFAGEGDPPSRDERIAAAVAARVGPLTRIECPSEESEWVEGAEISCNAFLQHGRPHVITLRFGKGDSFELLSAEPWPERAPGPKTPPSPAVYAGAGIAALFGTILLIAGIVRIIAATSGSMIAGPLPLAPKTTVMFPAPGVYTVYAEMPLLTWDLRGKSIALWDPVAAAWVRDLPTFPIHTNGFGTTRTPQCGFKIERPGEYVLMVGGLNEEHQYRSTLYVGPNTAMRQFLALIMIVAGGLTLFVAIFVAVMNAS